MKRTTCHAVRFLPLLCTGISVAMALETARMELPAEFEQRATRVGAEGFGGRNNGTYVIGDYRGKFTRSERGSASSIRFTSPAKASRRSRSSSTAMLSRLKQNARWRRAPYRWASSRSTRKK